MILSDRPTDLGYLGGRAFIQTLTACGINAIGANLTTLKAPADSAKKAVERGLSELPDELLPAHPICVREFYILEELLKGNMPAFCRTWRPVELSDTKGNRGTVFVMADCFAVGSDDDYVRVPLSGFGSQMIADKWCCLLPTEKIIAGAFRQARHQRYRHPLDCQGPKGEYWGEYQSSNEALLCHDYILQGIIACGSGKVDTTRWPNGDAELNALVKPKSKRGQRAFELRCEPANYNEHHLAKAPIWDVEKIATVDRDPNWSCTIGTVHPMELVVGHKKEVTIHPNVPADYPESYLSKSPKHKRVNPQLFFLGFFPERPPWYKEVVNGKEVTRPGWSHDQNIKAGVQYGGGSLHMAGFTDYAQGTRLVHPIMRVSRIKEKGSTNGEDLLHPEEEMLYEAVLTHPELYGIVSTQCFRKKADVRYPAPLYPPVGWPC